MKVVVTGGSGQLGSLLLERCARSRQIEQVTVLDLVPPAIPSPKFRFVEADVRDPEIRRHLEGADALVHLAFLVFSHRDRELFDSVNVGGSENVFSAAAEAGVSHVLYASSVAAYGVMPGHPVPLTEASPRRRDPHLAYAANKYDVEDYLDAFETAHPDIVITRLRPSVLLGRRMEHFLGQLLRRGILLDFQGPPFPLVWDEDVADAFLLALDRRPHGAFNLGTDDPVPTRELHGVGGIRVIRLPGRATNTLVTGLSLLRRVRLSAPMDPNWLRAGRHPVLPASDKARAELGWRPRCRTSREVVERFVREATRRTNPRVALFLRMADLVGRLTPLPVGDPATPMTIHLDLVGSDGGDFTIRVDWGRTRIERGIPRPNDAVVRLRSTDFVGLLTGQLEWRTAELTGKIRLLGEPTAEAAVGALIAAFRSHQLGGGPGAFASRRMSNWLAA